VLETFQKLNRELGRTIILITHEHTVAEHADRILSIRDGMLVSDEVNAKARTANLSMQNV
jgi:putative ABC transport system ATP-binding protein